ncbi:hypothetical protein ANO14919_126830 [Xylariales sp. No.14919]|nr:hypothetical protein F5X98DRAFT_383996 [Xylaria grammica]GAW23133.1 hypothetical protein ANO14919_126830 [Xylariales sp. No.14919]
MRVSPCKHCQKDNPDYWDDICVGCSYHPWNQCYHPDCGKLPPVKHEPRSTPTKSESDKSTPDKSKSKKATSSGNPSPD